MIRINNNAKAPKSRKGKWSFFLLILAIIVAGVWFLGDLSNKMYRENLSKITIISIEDKPYLLLYTTQLRPGKTSTTVSTLRVIDPENGKVISSLRRSVRSFSEIRIQFFTSNSVWITKRGHWNCYSFPGLKRELNEKQFKRTILEKFPEVNTVHSIKFDDLNGQFEIENNQGEKFAYFPGEFVDPDEPGWDLEQGKVVVFESFRDMGSYGTYRIPQLIKIEKAGIYIETVGEEKEVNYYPGQSLVEMLITDTGYAKNYAVFTPDSTCFLLDGNKRRVLYRLSEDSIGIKREQLMGDKVWLEGEFLRPFRNGNNIPETRHVTVFHDNLFIYWYSSLEEKENKASLTAIDYKTGKEIWNIELTANHKISPKYRPVQNLLIGEILVTVWAKGSYFYLTGINPSTGDLIWKFRK